VTRFWGGAEAFPVGFCRRLGAGVSSVA
jgi:hypothetical protein